MFTFLTYLAISTFLVFVVYKTNPMIFTNLKGSFIASPYFGFACIAVIATIDFINENYGSAFMYLIGAGGLLVISEHFNGSRDDEK